MAEYTLQDVMTAIMSLGTSLNTLTARVTALENNTNNTNNTPVAPVIPAAPRLVPPPVQQKTVEVKSPVNSDADDTDMYGFTGLLRTPFAEKKAPSVPQDNAKADRASGRRETIHAREFDSALEAAQPLPIFDRAPRTDHLRLDELYVSTLIKFFDDLVQYARVNGGLPKIATLLSDKVKEALIASDPRRYAGDRLYLLTPQQIYNLLVEQVQPRDRFDFVKEMTRNVKFTYTAKRAPSAEYFDAFYKALLLYKKNYLQVYEILSFNNRMAVPRCENKDGGLIKLFVIKIPYEYGTRTLSALDATKWEDVHLFLKDFYQHVESDRAAGDAARLTSHKFGGTTYATSKLQSLVLSPTAAPAPSPPAYADEMEFAAEYYESLFADDASFDEEIVFEADLAAMQHPSPAQKPFVQKPSAAPFAKKPTFNKDEPLACFAKILYGTCTKVNCKYSHKDEHVLRERAKMIELMQKQDALRKNSAAVQRPLHYVAAASDEDDQEY